MIGDTEEDESTARLLKIPFLAIWNGLRRPDLLKGDESGMELKDLINGRYLSKSL